MPQNNNQNYSYMPAHYQPLFWQAVMGAMVNLIILGALAAWALSIAKRAWKGEVIEFPL